MKPKQWDAFITYLDIIHRRTDRVWREHDEYLQYPDYDREDFRDEIDRRLIAEHFEEMLDTLTYREKHVIYYRFYDCKTLDEAAAEFCVTRERIRQIEGRALRKLRHPCRYRMILEPEEVKKRDAEKAERDRLRKIAEEERKKRDKEKEEERKRQHEIWWEAEGKAQHERNLELRNQRQLRLQEETRQRFRAQFEVQQAEELKRISEHNTHCKEMLSYQQMLIDRQLEAQRKAREEDARIEEERREMGCMKAVAFELLKYVKAEQHRLSQKTIARKAVENNDNRPYIWDSFKKKRVYTNQKEAHE